MNESEKNGRLIFVGVFALIAITANFTAYAIKRSILDSQKNARSRAEQIETEHVLAKKNADDEFAEHAAYLARYLTARPVRVRGITNVAIEISCEDPPFAAGLEKVISDQFPADKVKIVTALFTPAFVSDGLFATTFEGSPSALEKLELTNSLDYLVLAQQTVVYSTNAALANTITAALRLDLVTLPVIKGERKQTQTLRANGADFSKDAALKMAEERILKQASIATNLSFSLIVPSKE